jgi:hypothetical protein
MAEKHVRLAVVLDTLYQAVLPLRTNEERRLAPQRKFPDSSTKTGTGGVPYCSEGVRALG